MVIIMAVSEDISCVEKQFSYMVLLSDMICFFGSHDLDPADQVIDRSIYIICNDNWSILSLDHMHAYDMTILFDSCFSYRLFSIFWRKKNTCLFCSDRSMIHHSSLIWVIFQAWIQPFCFLDQTKSSNVWQLLDGDHDQLACYTTIFKFLLLFKQHNPCIDWFDR